MDVNAVDEGGLRRERASAVSETHSPLDRDGFARGRSGGVLGFEGEESGVSTVPQQCVHLLVEHQPHGLEPGDRVACGDVSSEHLFLAVCVNALQLF